MGHNGRPPKDQGTGLLQDNDRIMPAVLLLMGEGGPGKVRGAQWDRRSPAGRSVAVMPVGIRGFGRGAG